MLGFGKAKPSCGHHNHYNKFYDLHVGGDGEVYVRGTIVCRDCGHKINVALEVPDAVGKVIRENIQFGTYKRVETPERDRCKQTVADVYDNINIGNITAKVRQAIREEVKAAFDKS